jgi:Ca2+-binding RTX toxin-like protein
MGSITGTPNDDTLYGTPRDDWIRGRGGNDSIYGRAGDDTLDGGPGADILDGGPGNDTLRSHLEDIQAAGGQGFDTVAITGAAVPDDFIVTTGIAFDNPNVFVFKNGEFIGVELIEVERLEVNGGGGDDSLSVGDVFGVRTIMGFGGPVVVKGIELLDFRGDAGDDSLDGSEATGVVHASGGAGDDRLVGGVDDDRLLGDAGHDHLHGMDGDDHLAGGDGNDTVSGGPGQDVFVVDVFETGIDLILDFQEGDALQVNVTRPLDIFLPQAIQEPALEITLGNELTRLEITPFYPELVGSVSVDLVGNYQPNDFVFDGRTVTLADGGDIWGA